MHPLERAPVPEVDHEGAPAAEATCVTEPVRHDDDVCPQRSPESPPRTVLEDIGTDGAGILRLAGRASEPRDPGRCRSGQRLHGEGAGAVVDPEGAPDDP